MDFVTASLPFPEGAGNKSGCLGIGIGYLLIT